MFRVSTAGLLARPSTLFNKKLSCRRETARCFVRHRIFAKSLKVIRNDTILKLGHGFLFAILTKALSCIVSEIKRDSYRKSRFFHTPYTRCPARESPMEYCHTVWYVTTGQSNLTKSASRGTHSLVRGHPRGVESCTIEFLW